MTLGATEQDTAPHLPQSSPSGNSDGFTFIVYLDYNPIASAHATITTQLYNVTLLPVLISMVGSLIQLSNWSDPVKISRIMSFLCSEFPNGSLFHSQ